MPERPTYFPKSPSECLQETSGLKKTPCYLAAGSKPCTSVAGCPAAEALTEYQRRYGDKAVEMVLHFECVLSDLRIGGVTTEFTLRSTARAKAMHVG